MLSVQDIGKVLFYRPYPMIDQLLHRESEKSATGLKNVTRNEPLGPDDSLPTPLLLEACLQLEALLFVTEEELRSSELKYYGYLVSLHNVTFHRKVYAGETLILKIEVVKAFDNIMKFHFEGKIGDNLVVEGEASNFFGKL